MVRRVRWVTVFNTGYCSSQGEQGQCPGLPLRLFKWGVGELGACFSVHHSFMSLYQLPALPTVPQCSETILSQCGHVLQSFHPGLSQAGSHIRHALPLCFSCWSLLGTVGQSHWWRPLKSESFTPSTQRAPMLNATQLSSCRTLVWPWLFCNINSWVSRFVSVKLIPSVFVLSTCSRALVRFWDETFLGNICLQRI